MAQFAAPRLVSLLASTAVAVATCRQLAAHVPSPANLAHAYCRPWSDFRRHVIHNSMSTAAAETGREVPRVPWRHRVQASERRCDTLVMPPSDPASLLACPPGVHGNLSACTRLFHRKKTRAWDRVEITARRSTIIVFHPRSFTRSRPVKAVLSI
jgi:hypothetical protein